MRNISFSAKLVDKWTWVNLRFKSSSAERKRDTDRQRETDRKTERDVEASI